MRVLSCTHYVGAREHSLRRGCCPSVAAHGLRRRLLLRRVERCARSRDSLNSAPKRHSPGAAAARSRRLARVAGAAARLQTAADGTGSTAYLLGHAADATRTAAALSADRRSTSREVRAQRPRAPARACLRPQPLRRRAAAAATPPNPRARVALGSPDPARLAPAGVDADAPPPPRAGGRPRMRPGSVRNACNGRNGRRAGVQAASEGAGACGSAGGMCGTRADVVVAHGSVAGAPPRCRTRMRGTCISRRRRYDVLVAPRGSEACPGASDRCGRWCLATPGPCGVLGTSVMSRNTRHGALACCEKVRRFCEIESPVPRHFDEPIS